MKWVSGEQERRSRSDKPIVASAPSGKKLIEEIKPIKKSKGNNSTSDFARNLQRSLGKSNRDETRWERFPIFVPKGLKLVNLHRSNKSTILLRDPDARISISESRSVRLSGRKAALAGSVVVSPTIVRFKFYIPEVTNEDDVVVSVVEVRECD